MARMQDNQARRSRLRSERRVHITDVYTVHLGDQHPIRDRDHEEGIQSVSHFYFYLPFPS
jgi:hypothetical protein